MVVHCSQLCFYYAFGGCFCIQDTACLMRISRRQQHSSAVVSLLLPEPQNPEVS